MEFLVAIDGSEESKRALSYALEIATAAGASVTAVYAVDPAVYAEGGEDPVADLADVEDRLLIEDEGDAEEKGLEALETAREFAAERGVEVTTELLHGDPVEAVTSFAEEEGVDGIFVGHRGLSERYEQMLGSVAKSLVERASVPVTVVR